MFIVIRKYEVTTWRGAGLAQREQKGFLPLLRQMQGFRGYHLLEGGPDILVSITMFDKGLAHIKLI